MDALSFMMLSIVVGSCWTPGHNHHIQIKTTFPLNYAVLEFFVTYFHTTFNTELYCLLLQLYVKSLFDVLHINNIEREAEIKNTITINQVVKEQCNKTLDGITYNHIHIANGLDKCFYIIFTFLMKLEKKYSC